MIELSEVWSQFQEATAFEVHQITEIVAMKGISNREKLEILYGDYDYHNNCMEYLEEMIEILKSEDDGNDFLEMHNL
jgi:hypothetical protein